MSDLTVANGLQREGGGIKLGDNGGDFPGTLTLTRVAVTGNRATTGWGGGGIFVDEGCTLNLIESTVSGNRTFPHPIHKSPSSPMTAATAASV